MSLQVWLPLNGNLNNQGLSNVTVANNGATVSTSGKIGSCYLVNSDKKISFSSYPWMTMKPQYNFSCFLWVKGTTSGWLFACSAWEFRLRPDYIQIHLGGSGYYPARYTATFDTNTWYHLGFTWNGTEGKLCLYLNGNLVATSDVPSSASYDIASSFNIPYDGPRYINDFRLYDHCLSAKEVKEISKGLSLHYKLSDPYIESTTNYSSQSASSGGWNNSGSSVRNNNDTSVNRVSSDCPVLSIQQTAAGNSAITFGNVSTSTYTTLKGATVTASVYVYISDINCSSNIIYLRSTVNDNKEGNNICDFQYNGSTNPQNWPKNQWIRIEGTGTIVSNETAVYFCTYTNNLNEKRYFTCWQLELKDHSTPFVVGSRSESLCFDASGFGNNGVVRNQSSISIERDSPRYEVSTVFNGTPFIIGQNLNGAKSTDALSLCAWVNPSQVSGGYNIVSSYEGGGAGLHISSGNIYFQIYSGGYIGVSGGSVSANTWYHVVGTYDNSKLRIYINGELKGEVSKTGNITYNSNTPWSIAVNPSGTGDGGEHFYGKLSDVRIYSTALSASDIKELYNTSASVDKNGNMYAYEFKEE